MGVAQSAEAMHSKRIQCGFESHVPHGFIAQWIEHESSKLGIKVRFLLDPQRKFEVMYRAAVRPPKLSACGGTADTAVLETAEHCSLEVQILSGVPRFYRTMDSTLPCEGRNSGSTPDRITRIVGGEAYLTALLKRRSRKGTVGSNPTLSANGSSLIQ